MTINEKALELHEKMERQARYRLQSTEAKKPERDLALAYTPGVAEPCKVIAEDPESCIPLHHQVQYCSRCLRRKRRSGTWQYRTVSSYAGYGRKSRSV